MSNPAVKCFTCIKREGTSKAGKHYCFYEALVVDEISGISGYINSNKPLDPGNTYGLIPVLRSDYDHKLSFGLEVEEY